MRIASTFHEPARTIRSRFNSHRPDHFHTVVDEGVGEDEPDLRFTVLGPSRTDPAQHSPRSRKSHVKFPVTIEHRKIEAKIYAKTESYPFYRVSAYVGGKRRVSSFASYTEAKTAAENLVRDIAAGSQAAALTHAQANDALAGPRASTR